MNRLPKILTIVIGLLSFGSLALAEVKMGVTIGAIDMEPSALEEKFNANTNKVTADSEEIQVPYASIFIEKDLGPVSLGIDITPYDLDSEELNNARTATRGDGSQDTTDSKVTVTVENPIMIYALLQNDAGAFVRLGASHANIRTDEVLTTGSKYPDADLYGGHVSFGVERAFGANDLSFRVEAGYSGYTNVTVVNNQSARPTKVHVQDIDGITARVSLLKTF
jgi:hypothetical protein